MRIFLGLMMLAMMIISSGCSENEKTVEKVALAAPLKSPKKEESFFEFIERTAEENTVPHSDKFVTANKNFSNIQLYEYNKPVYDAYGFWQRTEGNMAVTLPELQPYYGEHIVYLTFDDGPDDKNTPQILDILRNEGVPATFYVLGNMVEAYPDVLRRIFNEGHAIGNHSYNHTYKELYASPWDFISQFQRTDDIIMSVIGVRPLIIRAPGGTTGAFNSDYWDIVKSSGYVEHDWNISTGDASPKGATAADEIANVTSQMDTYNFKSAIVLMHSTAQKNATVEALPDIIHFFKERGYTFGVITPMTPQPW